MIYMIKEKILDGYYKNGIRTFGKAEIANLALSTFALGASFGLVVANIAQGNTCEVETAAHTEVSFNAPNAGPYSAANGLK